MTAPQKAGVRGAKDAAREKAARKQAEMEAVRRAGRTGGAVDEKLIAARTQEILSQEETGNQPLTLLRRASDGVSLQSLEMCIRRDLEDSKKLDRGSAFVGVRIGLALQAGKALVQHGMFESWVESNFEGFSARRAQYYLKLGKVFLQETSGKLQLPQATEMGTLMVRSNDGSELHGAVMTFIGDNTLAELMSKHGIKANTAAPGGFRPSAFMVAKYQGEHPELSGKPFEQWPAEAQEAFRTWQAEQVERNDGNEAMRVAAEGKWASIRESLADHGLKRKSFALLTKKQLEETRDVLALVSKELGKALRDK